MKNTDWLVIGSATIDCIVQGSVAVYKSGGVSIYGGLTLARSGESVAVCSNLAARDRDVVEPLAREGVILHCGESPQTTSFVNYIDGDERQQKMTAAAKPIGREILRTACTGGKYVLLGPLHPRDIGEDVLAYWASETDAVVCVDVQGFARSIAGEWVRSQIAPKMQTVLTVAHIVKVAGGELALLLAWAGCSLAELMRVYRLREVVVTNGSHGGYIRVAAGQEVYFSAKEVREVVDPTGAGDVFFAAYLIERLRRKSTVEAAAERAAEQAAAQVAGRFIGGGELRLKRPH